MSEFKWRHFVRGFKTLKTAYATIMGIEVMRVLRKGQAATFNLTQDICGERAFWNTPSASVSVRSQKRSRSSVKR